MASRKWIKLWCDQWLNGTLRQDEYGDFDLEALLSEPESRQNILRLIMRGLWADTLSLAGDGKYGDIGEIKMSSTVGLTDEQIADIFRVPIGLWRWAKAELSKGENARIEVSEQNIINIINWPKYQSEYQRQKPYRGRKEESSKEEKKDNLEEEDIRIRNRGRRRYRYRSEISNLELLSKVITEGYKQRLQESYPELYVEDEINKLMLYYSDSEDDIISPEVTIANWFANARRWRFK